MTRLALPLALTLAATVIAAAGWDLRKRRIPNALVLSGAIAGGRAAIVAEQMAGGAVVSAGAGLVSAAIPAARNGGRRCETDGGDRRHHGLAELLHRVPPHRHFGRSSGCRAGPNVATILRELAHLRAPHERRPDLSIDSPASVTLPYAIPMALGSLVFLMPWPRGEPGGRRGDDSGDVDGIRKHHALRGSRRIWPRRIVWCRASPAARMPPAEGQVWRSRAHNGIYLTPLLLSL